MAQVKLYDTTLRDGMGGHGMSLSVDEKLKVVDSLDALGVQFIEAGFPSSNPKEAELFGRLAELELANSTIAAFGMTRRGGVAAAEDAALATLVDSFAPVVCLVGKSWRLHLEKVIRVSEEENLAMIRDSVAFCRGAGKRVVFDAEHFFDGYRDDAGFALECVRAAAEVGAENVTLCDTNGGSLPAFVGAAVAASSSRRRRGGDRHPHAQRRRVRRRQQPRRRRGGCPARAGHGQRLRRALRQRQPRLDPASAAAEDGLRRGRRRAAREPDGDRPLPRRALQHGGRPGPALRRAQRLRPQGGDARRRRRRRRQHLRAPRPGPGRQRPRDPRLGAVGQGDDPHPGASRRASSSTTRRRRGRSSGSRSASTAATTTRRRRPPSSCCCARRRAATRPCSSSRASG